MPKEEWRESFSPRIAAARSALRLLDPESIARRSGDVEGKDYFFVDRQTFERPVDPGESQDRIVRAGRFEEHGVLGEFAEFGAHPVGQLGADLDVARLVEAGRGGEAVVGMRALVTGGGGIDRLGEGEIEAVGTPRD